MSQQPDKFFRDKLHNYQKPVSADAWQRISEHVHKKADAKLWLKIAAAIFVPALAAVLVFTIRFNEPDRVIATTAKSPEKVNPVVPNKSLAETSAGETTERKDKLESIVSQQAQPQIKAEKPLRRSEKRSLSLAHEEEKTAIVEPTTRLATKDTSEYKVAQTESAAVHNKSEMRAKSLTIVFSAQEVNQKYLTKKTEKEATSEEKESSTLKKVLDKAYDLTHNQDPIGELRQKKNEILAMNFKNDGQRNEND